MVSEWGRGKTCIDSASRPGEKGKCLPIIAEATWENDYGVGAGERARGGGGGESCLDGIPSRSNNNKFQLLHTSETGVHPPPSLSYLKKMK